MSDAATDPTGQPAHCPEHDLQQLAESLAAPAAEVLRQLSSVAISGFRALMQSEFERGRAAGIVEASSRQPGPFVLHRSQVPPQITPEEVARHLRASRGQ